jgi:hypothetical protein
MDGVRLGRTVGVVVPAGVNVGLAVGVGLDVGVQLGTGLVVAVGSAVSEAVRLRAIVGKAVGAGRAMAETDQPAAIAASNTPNASRPNHSFWTVMGAI